MQKRLKISDIGGFTLVELAIVLVIVGILLGVGSSMVGVLSGAVKVRQAKDSLDENSQAVASWASANNRLPQITDFNSGTPVAKTQMDPWSRPVVFLYYSSLARTNPNKDTICGRRSTPLTVTTSNPPTTVSNVAYVLLSGGDTGAATLNSSFASGSTLGALTYPVKTLIPRDAASNTAVGGDATGNILIDSSNTDIVRWVTLDELRSKVGCQGAPMKIVNNELPFGSASSPYSATLTADGGVPFNATDSYRWCVQTTVAPLPPATGLNFKKPDGSTVGNTLFEMNCSTYPVTSWPTAGQLVISGTPTPPGSYFFTVYVSDNNSNTASKPFVLTVNP